MKNKEKQLKLMLTEAQTLLAKNNMLLSGRKTRSDKGKKRKTQKYTRKHTPEWKYKVIMSKLLKNKNVNIYTDINGYYLDIEEKFKPEYGEFHYKLKDGTKKTSYVKYKRIQKYIPLEEYRFNSWLFLATSERANDLIRLPHRDLTRWALDCAKMPPNDSLNFFLKKAYTHKSLFLEFYHINESDINDWDYKTWREHYSCIPAVELDIPFKFNLRHKPGTKHFHPEWKSHITRMRAQARSNEKINKDKRSWSAKVSRRKGVNEN